jgi:hypothetical protein
MKNNIEVGKKKIMARHTPMNKECENSLWKMCKSINAYQTLRFKNVAHSKYDSQLKGLGQGAK